MKNVVGGGGSEKVETNMVDERQLAQLRSLGYLSGFSPQRYDLNGQGPDPKDRVGILKLLYEAENPIAHLPEVDAIADTVGGETIARLLPKIRKGGTLASVVGEPAAAKGRDLRVRAFVSHPDGKRLGDLAEAAARGELRIPIGNRLPISEVREAHRLAERGADGKILLTM